MKSYQGIRATQPESTDAPRANGVPGLFTKRLIQLSLGHLLLGQGDEVARDNMEVARLTERPPACPCGS